MLRSWALLSLLVVVGALADSVSAGQRRSDQLDSLAPIAGLETLVNSLFDFRQGRFSTLYDFYVQVGLEDVVARTAVVFTFAGVAVLVALSVDYMIQLLTSLTNKKRTVPETRALTLTPESIQAAVSLIERAAALWE